MTWDEFDAWAPHSVRGSADQRVASGLGPGPDARATAQRQFDAELPDGIATPHQLLHTVRASEPGRPIVGHLWLRVAPRSDEVEAYLMDVEVLEAVRGQGYGRAALVAATALAERLGASVLRLNVFAAAEPALRLYRSLGLQVTATTMARWLVAPDPAQPHDPMLPHDLADPTDPQDAAGPTGAGSRPSDGPGVELRPMTDGEFAALRPRLVSDYADNLVRAGSMSSSQALRHAEDSVSGLLPDGPASRDQLLWTATDGGTPVGRLWLGLSTRSDGRHAYGYQLEVESRLRRRGYGRAVLEAASARCRELGVRSVGLSVFEDNRGARQLYEQQGFRVTARSMAKALPG